MPLSKLDELHLTDVLQGFSEDGAEDRVRLLLEQEHTSSFGPGLQRGLLAYSLRGRNVTSATASADAP